MKLGYLTDFSKEEVDFAAKAGFECLSLFISQDTVENEPPKYWDKLVDTCRAEGIEISAFGGYFQHFSPNGDERKAANAAFIRLMQIAAGHGVDVIATNTWGDPDKSVDENIPMYKTIFSEYAKAASANGVRIAMENCPHMGGYPIRIGNISYAPETWEKLFDAVPDDAIGLEYDPSHLVWLFVDYLQAARKFVDRIYHVHAKDTEILVEELSRKGILGDGWWRYRLPGMGIVEWTELMKILKDGGYTGNMVIEHEDPLYEGKKRHEGLELGLKNLQDERKEAGWKS